MRRWLHLGHEVVDDDSAVVAVCVEQARGRVPVIAGAGSNDTRVAAANMLAARGLALDAADWARLARELEGAFPGLETRVYGA